MEITRSPRQVIDDAVDLYGYNVAQNIFQTIFSTVRDVSLDLALEDPLTGIRIMYSDEMESEVIGASRDWDNIELVLSTHHEPHVVARAIGGTVIHEVTHVKQFQWNCSYGDGTTDIIDNKSLIGAVMAEGVALQHEITRLSRSDLPADFYEKYIHIAANEAIQTIQELVSIPDEMASYELFDDYLYGRNHTIQRRGYKAAAFVVGSLIQSSGVTIRQLTEITDEEYQSICRRYCLDKRLVIDTSKRHK